MKNTLRFMIALAGVVLVATPIVNAQAENRPKAGERGPGRGLNADQLAEQLGLSAEQKAKVAEIIKAQREQMQALAPEERREKGRAIMQETRKSINAVLTPEQQAKWKEMQPQGAKGAKGEKGGKREAN